jgi:hypothetical protein
LIYLRKDDLLFSKIDLRNAMAHNEQDMFGDIDRYDSNRLLNSSTEDLAEFFVDKYLINPIVIKEEEICAEQEETQVDVRYDQNRFIRDRSKPCYVKGTTVTLDIPFTGEADLFKSQPSSYTVSPPLGQVTGNVLRISVSTTDHNAELVKNELNRTLDEVKKYVEWIRADLSPWNASLSEKAKNRIRTRKEKLLRDQGLVANLGFPMKKRSDNLATYVAPDVRRKMPPKLLNASSAPYIPEPTLVMEEYEHILSLIKLTAQMLERSPQAFKGMNEENLRDQFLVPLNSHYEGQASGETFNFSGKTDILVRVKDKNIFIAECKIWRGQKALSEAIDQLLGYATWRDTKTALVIFNRNKDLSNVLGKIPDSVKTHPNFKCELPYLDETGFRYVFSHRDDLNRELTLTVLVFEVPQ